MRTTECTVIQIVRRKELSSLSDAKKETSWGCESHVVCCQRAKNQNVSRSRMEKGFREIGCSVWAIRWHCRDIHSYEMDSVHDRSVGCYQIRIEHLDAAPEGSPAEFLFCDYISRFCLPFYRVTSISRHQDTWYHRRLINIVFASIFAFLHRIDTLRYSVNIHWGSFESNSQRNWWDSRVSV